MKNILKYITTAWKTNIFFWKESKTYVAPWKLRDYLYAPIAWAKFMGFIK